MDVDEWLRSFAIEMLFGIGDNYGGGNVMHNVLLYQRPADAKWMFFPHDMDFTFSSGSTSAFNTNPDLAKLITKPANSRAYYGHLLNLCNTVYNTTYLQPWAVHYNKFLNEDLTTFMSYISTRQASAISAVKAAVPQVSFAITTNGGQPLTVNSSFATIQGSGWVDVRDIRIAGTTQPLVVNWIGTGTWSVTIPVATGTHSVTLEAVGFDGTVIGTSTIVITNNVTNTWAPLRINEWLASNHTFLDPADNSTDDWIEIYNPTASPVSLSSWIIGDSGINYTIPAGYTVPAGGFLLVWADNQIAQNTGTGQLHVPFQLSSSGDTINLTAPDNQAIDSVQFGPQTTDVSEGRYSDGTPGSHPLTYPSPLGRNIFTVPSITLNGSVATLGFSTTPGVKYQVQTSNDLATWQPLGALTTATSSTMSVQEDIGTLPAHFYRVVVAP